MQKFSVGEVLKSRGIIGHDILDPVDEGDLGAVTMVALVEAGDLAEVGGWSTGGSAALEVTSESRSVVRQVGDGGASNVVGVCDVVQLDYHGSLFEVAVGDVAMRVVARHQSPN